MLALPLGLAVMVGAGVVVARTVDTDALARAWQSLSSAPLSVMAVLAVFGSAFALRAAAWTWVLPDLSLGQSAAGVHLALGANHVLPLRLGESFRVLSIVRRSGIGAREATASTLTLRLADMVAVFLLAAITGPAVLAGVLGGWLWLLLPALVAAGAGAMIWLRHVGQTGRGRVRMPGPAVMGAVVAAWLLEAVLVWQSAHWVGIGLRPHEAVLVTSVSVGAQLAAVAPGGFGTYEAASVAAYVALGIGGEVALAAALTAHALKTGYSLLAGGLSLVWPAPSLLGHLRLPEPRPPRPPVAVLRDDAPIVVFMPAHDEEASIGNVIARVPTSVRGRRVGVMVIDDGSRDSTRQIAVEAGAEVVSFSENRGLGAAVREGLRLGVERGAAVVAFFDADGEYPPEELASVVGPVLEGRADYVVGSRFAGRIDHMRLHRRIGNRLLTKLLAFWSRHPLTDGQSGYRALSLAAAADAEIIHDYNYAQVLTLDLLAKGFVYEEVPISYHFRRQGHSFIRLGRYLRAVLPAVHREINGQRRSEAAEQAEPDLAVI
ncbi:MAG: hypothetical protein JJLCMIEE_01621 [Acidimicrobiales bacterium]|nr:hypothetical protein [Acidimicrobiales bacterium]